MTIERRGPAGLGQGDHPSGRCRKAIAATCQLEWGPVEHATLMVSKHKGTIVLAPQVTGSCVMSLDEQGATALCNRLSVWLE